MKKIFFLLFYLSSVSVSNAQVSDLIGTWTRFEQTQIEFGGLPVKMTEDQFKEEGGGC